MDKDLVEQTLKGNKKAFDQLYKKYLNKIYKTVSSRVSSRVEAEDLVQDIFVSVFESLTKFDINFSFSTWIYTITRNKVNDYLRRKYKFNEIGLDILKVSNIENVKEEFESKEKVSKKNKAEKLIEILPSKYQELMKLSFIDGLSNRQVAEKIGISINNVKVTKNRTIKLLQKLLTENNE